MKNLIFPLLKFETNISKIAHLKIEFIRFLVLLAKKDFDILMKKIPSKYLFIF